MASIDIKFSNGQQSLYGNLHQIHASSRQDVERIYREGQKDNLDQLYIQAGDEYYVLEGEELDLSILKQGLAPVQVNIAGQTTDSVDILFADDAIHSASEGVQATKSWAVGSVLSGLVGATGFTLSKMGQLSSSQALIVQGTTEVSQAVTVSQAAKKIPINILKGSSEQILKPKPAGNSLMDKLLKDLKPTQGTIIKHNAKDNPVIRKGIETAQGAFKASEQGIARASQGITKSPGLRASLYIVGAGLAVAGTVVAAGAIYGATRGDESAIDKFKQREVK